jgi:hypothetical protein
LTMPNSIAGRAYSRRSSLAAADNPRSSQPWQEEIAGPLWALPDCCHGPPAARLRRALGRARSRWFAGLQNAPKWTTFKPSSRGGAPGPNAGPRARSRLTEDATRASQDLATRQESLP